MLKAVFISSLSVCISVIGLCQSSDQSLVQKCNYELKDLDKFTGKHIFHTKPEYLWQNGMKGNSIAFSAKRNGDENCLQMRYSTRDAIIFPSSSELHFLLGNDQVVNLKCIKTEKPKRDGRYWIHYPEYNLTDKDIEQLMESGITDIQFFLKKGKVRREIIAKNKLVIADLLHCIE